MKKWGLIKEEKEEGANRWNGGGRGAHVEGENENNQRMMNHTSDHRGIHPQSD